jgi:hypothetical protein
MLQVIGSRAIAIPWEMIKLQDSVMAGPVPVMTPEVRSKL